MQLRGTWTGRKGGDNTERESGHPVSQRPSEDDANVMPGVEDDDSEGDLRMNFTRPSLMALSERKHRT